MNRLVECSGFIWGRVEVPPFSVVAGEAVCLHLPPVSSPHAVGEWGERELGEYFSSEASCPAVAVRGLAVYAVHPLPSRWLWFSTNPPIRRWLVQRAGLSPERAAEVAETMGLAPRVRLCDLSWTDRMLLSLRAAMSRRPNVLVFDNWGLGDDGVQLLCETAAGRAAELGAIYISHPRSRARPCFPQATCLPLRYAAAVGKSAA